MASTRPSAMAWRARSWGVQCVRCSPSAIGSRQANSTICALGRGGNLLRTPRSRLVPQESLDAFLRITAANTPHGGPTALQPRGDGLDRLAGRDSQDKARVLDLKEGQASATGDRAEDRQIAVRNRDGMRSSPSHATTSQAEKQG